MELELQRFDIKKSDYGALSPEELHFFLLITGITNEISFLTKLSVYSLLSLPSEADLEGNSLSMLILFLHKLLAAKLFEAHELLKVRYFGAKISVHYKDDDDLTAILRDINSYFSKENAIEKLRHNFSSHHYDDDKLLVAAFNDLSDDYDLSHYTTGQIS